MAAGPCCWGRQRPAGGAVCGHGRAPAAALHPYLALRDRDTLLPDRALRRRVWRPIGSPGVVLVDGRVVGIWRPRKQGQRLALTVEPFVRLPRPTRDAIQAEAEHAAPYRGATTAEVSFTGSWLARSIPIRRSTPLRLAHSCSTGFSSGAQAGSGPTTSQDRCRPSRARIAWLRWATPASN
jgi:hypothetical protein